MSADTLLQLEQRLIAEAQPFAVVTVIRAGPPTSAWVGAQALVDGGGCCTAGLAVVVRGRS